MCLYNIYLNGGTQANFYASYPPETLNTRTIFVGPKVPILHRFHRSVVVQTVKLWSTIIVLWFLLFQS